MLNPQAHDLPDLGYRFQQRELLDQALMHRSRGPHNNERMEFLGDAVLDLMLAEHLYTNRPDWSEADMSRARADMVNARRLSEIALTLDLGRYIAVGRGQENIRKNTNLLADAVEAIIGAAFLDGGMKAAKHVAITIGVL